jgi:hypothetical protein
VRTVFLFEGFKGWSVWDSAAESVRLQVDELIRDSGEFDAVTDFDRTLRSPYGHERILRPLSAATTRTPSTRGCRRWSARSTSRT